jgi:hypothetical protein
MNELQQRTFQKVQLLSNIRETEVREMLLALVEQDKSPLQLSEQQQTELGKRLELAEREGFEPPEGLHPLRFSRPSR